MKRIFLIPLGLWSLSHLIYSQNISITGESPNYFLKVDEVVSNGVRITETLAGQLSRFAPGDKVMVIQMTGVTIDTTSASFKTTEVRTKDSIKNTGKFEILQVDEVTTGSDTMIYFTDDLSNQYNDFEKIQLVRFIEGETVTVTGTLSPRAWDGNVGGILAIIGIDTVRLANSTILDVSGKGFRGGAVPSEIYPDGLCRFGLSAAIKDTLYFRSYQLGRSGNKGEGIITTLWPYTKGTGYNINGGGAGNGLLAGGGGGSNYLAGGDGGQQSAFCTASYSVKGGWGGYGCYELYSNPEKPKVIMGGGGGSGNRVSGSTASRGGNGGGLAIIITGTLVSGSNVSIRANGENGTPANTTGSGGGGGGGGTILIDATGFEGSPFTVQIRGGNGSSTTNAVPNCNGAGGSGSGGVFWHAGATIPVAGVDSTNGNPGTTAGGAIYAIHNGLAGLSGVTLENLIVPLTGFLFNTVRGIDTLCATQVPGMFAASQPKGGDGVYSHVWQQSTDNVNWFAAAGVGDLRTFQPVALNQTTYYRRIVGSQNPVTLESIDDTSRVVEIFVYPAIANNNILGTDSICFNNNARALNGALTPVTGGNNAFSYIWQQSNDLVQWTNSATGASYDPDVLTESTHYRRIVNSTAYCSDTSSFVTVTVLPSIDNNTFAVADTSICENSSPGQINIDSPWGGDGIYSYQWQFRTTGSWTDIPLTTDSIMYSVGILTDTTSYRRIVFSGNDDACIDTSNARNIIIRPLITRNTILGSAIQYTCFNTPAMLTGSEPANGFGPGSYGYSWEESTDNLVWQTVTSSNRDYQTGNLAGTRYYRRTVFSTPQNHECSNVSEAIEVRVNPLPTANVFNAFDTLCAGSTLYVKYNVNGNGPFSVTISGESIASQTKSNVIGPVDSIAFTPLATQEFVIVSVEDDSSCLADPDSFIPLITGIVYEVPVAQAGVDKEACGDSFTLEAVKTNAAFKGLWTASAVSFSDATLENCIVTMDNYGPNVFTWTETNWQCTDNDEVEILFYEQPQVPDAGPDQELVFVYQTPLTASVPTAGNGKWTLGSGSGVFDDDTRPDALVSQLSDQATLKWTVTNGTCPEVSDSMSISIDPLVIPKGFTPNGDGKNDFFNLGAVNAEKINIKIFNRSGILVYESDEYCSDDLSGMACKRWTGENMNNVRLPEGTYFYIVTIKVAGKTEEVQFRSFVEIMR